MNKLRISESSKDNFIFLFSLSKSELSDITSFFKSIPIGMVSNTLMEFAFEKLNRFEKEDILKILTLYFNFSNAKEDLEYDDETFIKDLVEVLDEAKDSSLKIDDYKKSVLFDIFYSNNDSNITRSIINEYLVNNNNLHRVKITTDIRPVFDKKYTLVGSAIVNQLRIDYQNNEDDKSFSVSLDEIDIDDLIKVLNETKNKITKIKENFNDLKIINITK